MSDSVNETLFYALYLGSSVITDSGDKKPIKIATRLIIDQEDILAQSHEVNIIVDSSGIKVVRPTDSDNSEHKIVNNSGTFINVDYDHVSSYFILREDNKVVSIVLTDNSFATKAHVFMLTNTDLARQLVTNIFHNFSNQTELIATESTAKLVTKQSSDFILSDDEECPKEPTNDVNSTQCAQVTSTCLLDI